MAVAGSAGALIVCTWAGLLGSGWRSGPAEFPPPPRMRVESGFQQRILGLGVWESSLAVRLPAPQDWRWALGAVSLDAGHVQELTGRAWIWRTGRTVTLGLSPVVRRATVDDFALLDARMEVVAGRELGWGTDRLTLAMGVDAPLRDPARVPPAQHVVAMGWTSQGWAAGLARTSPRYGGVARWQTALRVGSDRAHLFVRWDATGSRVGVAWESARIAASVSLPTSGLLPSGPSLWLGWSP